MKHLAVILFLSLTLSSSHALYPAGTKSVIIRIDDIQDYFHTSPYLLTEKMLLQHQIDARIPTLLSIIAYNFGTEPELVGQIRKGLDQEIFTVGIHGWTHTPYAAMSLSTQATNMQYAKDKLETIFGVQVFTFIPPYDNYNDATIEAMKQNQLTVISSSAYLGDIPIEDDGITYIPETVTTATLLNQSSWVAVPFESIIQQLQDSWGNYGLATVVVHPQQFTGENFEELWAIYLRTIDWIQANHGTIIKLELQTPKIEYAIHPLDLSVGILVGIVSTILVYTGIEKRNKGKRQQETRENSPRVNESLPSNRIEVSS